MVAPEAPERLLALLLAVELERDLALVWELLVLEEALAQAQAPPEQLPALEQRELQLPSSQAAAREQPLVLYLLRHPPLHRQLHRQPEVPEVSESAVQPQP